MKTAESTKFKNLQLALALGGLVFLAAACKPVTPDAPVSPAAIMNQDLSESPTSITQEKQASAPADLIQLKAAMYTEGCKQVGQPEAVLKLHPKLAAGSAFVINEKTGLRGDTKFEMTYDMRLSALPAAAAPLVYNVSLENLRLSGFHGATTDGDTENLTRQCVVLDATSALERCSQPNIPLSDELSQQLRQSQTQSADCQLSAIPKFPGNADQWSTAQYTLKNQKQVGAFVHRTQVGMTQTCADNPTPKTVIVTMVTATSNDVVASSYSHCGGEALYSKTSLRDSASGALLSLQINSTLIAPLVAVPVAL